LFFSGLVFCLALPLLLGNAGLQTGLEFAIMLCLAVLWNLLAGFGGIVSIGQQVFVGVGGYTLFALVALAGFPVMAALPCSLIVCAILALLAAPLLFRLRGPQFAIGSWVFAEILRLTLAQLPAMGGGSGMSLPAAAVFAISHIRSQRLMVFYLFSVVLALAVYVGTWAILKSRIGLALRAVRDAEGAAASLGIDIHTLKRYLYIITGMFTGLAGALMFLSTARLSPDSAFSVVDWTADVIFITVIGGVGRLEGPLLGCVVFFALRTFFSSYAEWYMIGLGILAVGMMLVNPKGIGGLVERLQAFAASDRHKRAV